MSIYIHFFSNIIYLVYKQCFDTDYVNPLFNKVPLRFKSAYVSC